MRFVLLLTASVACLAVAACGNPDTQVKQSDVAAQDGSALPDAVTVAPGQLVASPEVKVAIPNATIVAQAGDCTIFRVDVPGEDENFKRTLYIAQSEHSNHTCSVSTGR